MNQTLDFTDFFAVIRTQPKGDHLTTIALFMRDNGIESLPELAKLLALSNRTGWKETLLIIQDQTGYSLELPENVKETARKMNFVPHPCHQKVQVFEKLLKDTRSGVPISVAS